LHMRTISDMCINVSYEIMIGMFNPTFNTISVIS
jgi:hypothetical protein